MKTILNTDTGELNIPIAEGFYIQTKFDIVTKETLNLKADITDHLVEDGSYVNDHIAIKPITYTLSGLKAENCFEGSKIAGVQVDLPPETLVEKLNPLSAIAPTVSGYVQSAINIKNKIEKTVKKYVDLAQTAVNTGKTLKNIYDVFQKSGGFQNWKSALSASLLTLGQVPVFANTKHKRWSKDLLQARAIREIQEKMYKREPVYVSTGWGISIEKNMNPFYITDVQVQQDDSYQRSEISITLKEVRYVNTLAVSNSNTSSRQDTTAGNNRNVAQSEQVEKGGTKGTIVAGKEVGGYSDIKNKMSRWIK